ncbi:MAG: F0F1 ATP synthase subunit delta [Betaproteobacteria bacterium]|nr:F0F1 ATP synthase subunit delta [Betaproteobacteria bacterium]
MAELSTVARPYAEAAFKLARETGSVAAWTDLLVNLGRIVADPQVKAVVGDPALSASRLVEFLGGIVPGGLEGDTARFVTTLAENGRIETLPEVAAQFHALRNRDEGRADLLVESAFPMDDVALADLVGAMERRFGRRLTAEVRITPELIGGVRVTVGDEVLDASVRGRLAQMATALQS